MCSMVQQWRVKPVATACQQSQSPLILFLFFGKLHMYLSFYLSRLQDTVKHSFFKAVSHGVGKKDVHFFEGINHKAAKGVISWMCRFKWKHLTKKNKKNKKIQLLPRYSAVGLIKRRSPAWQSKLSWGQNILIHIDREALAWKLQQLLTQCVAR